MATTTTLRRGMVMPRSPDISKDDNALMRAIAQRRDFQAFVELCRRHERAAYNLARYILRNDDDAQDAVQDAFTQVWSSSSRFRAGNPRAWILRIVQRSCWAQRRASKARNEKEMTGMEKTDSARVDVSPDEHAERAELSGALRSLLDGLTLQERGIVALRFGADLSHDDIAETMSMPRSTVSKRLKDILARLRVDLAGAGFAGAAAQLTPAAIGESVCSGHPVPEGLAKRILEIASRSDSLRAAPVTSIAQGTGHLAAWLLGISAVLAIGASAWWWLQTPHRNAVPVHPSPKEKHEPAISLPRTWTFEKGLPTDLKPVAGKWEWMKAENGRQAAVAMREEVWVALPVGLPRRPMCLSIRCRFVAQKVSSALFDAEWLDRQATIPRTLYAARENVSVDPKRIELRHYVWGRRIATVVNGKIHCVCVWDKAWPTKTLAFRMSNLSMDRVELRAVDTDAIPQVARVADPGSTGIFKKPIRPLGYRFGDKREELEEIP